MAVLNLRDVPDELARELRVEAAQADMGVREYCVAVLSSRKKIADISVGGGATEGGGDPCLPRGGKAQEPVDIVLKARSRGITMLAAGMSIFPDGVPCAHAGCLSHLSHPCEGCGRIGGVLDEGCNMMGGGEDGLCSIASGCKGCGQERVLRAKRKEVERVNNISAPPKLEAMKSLCVRLAGERQDWQNSMALSDGWEAAAVDKEFAEFFHAAGIKLEREILRRWGLEEKADGIKGSGEAGQDYGSVGGDSKPVAEGDNGAQELAVGVGKPGVNMKALRAICAGNIPDKIIDEANSELLRRLDEIVNPDPHEVDLCGFKSYNEEDGEWYVCAKEKHGVKVKHGEWLKV